MLCTDAVCVLSQLSLKEAMDDVQAVADALETARPSVGDIVKLVKKLLFVLETATGKKLGLPEHWSEQNVRHCQPLISVCCTAMTVEIVGG